MTDFLPLKKDLFALVGNTPMIGLSSYCEKIGAAAAIYAKLESHNPSGSIKARPAKAMLLAAEAEGLIKPGATIIEPTSGNTGIALALFARVLGYEIILTMPKSMSVERRQLLSAYGAKLVFVDNMSEAQKKADELLLSTPNSFMPSQFTNPVNAQAHYDTTGPELWEQSKGKIDVFVAGVGTGGTITGAGKYLREKNPEIEIIAVEPKSSCVLSGGSPAPHGLQGIGAGFVPKLLDTSIYNRVIAVSDEEAFETCRELLLTEGVFAGISSGAALRAAGMLALLPENAGKNISVIFPDGGEKYLSSGVFRAAE